MGSVYKMCKHFSADGDVELLSSGPETVVLNADAVYVTTYSVLHLTMQLHRSAYFTSAEKSLPMSEVIFRFYANYTLRLRKTTLMLHTVTSTHINRF